MMAIEKEQALEIARQRLREECGPEMVIQEQTIMERDFGWVFLSVSQAFLQTGNPSKAIPGVGPLVVHKADGSTRFLSSSGPPEAGADIYEQQWRQGQSS